VDPDAVDGGSLNAKATVRAIVGAENAGLLRSCCLTVDAVSVLGRPIYAITTVRAGVIAIDTTLLIRRGLAVGAVAVG